MFHIHIVALLHIVTDSLLAEHVLSGVESIESNLTVGVERSGDNHSVNVLVVEQVSVVAIYLGFRSHFKRFVDRWLVNVGDSHDVDFRVLHQKAH